MSKAISFTSKISLTPYHSFTKLLNQIQKYNIKEIKTPKVPFRFSSTDRSPTLLFDLLFNLLQSFIHKLIISIKKLNHPIISIFSTFFIRILNFFTSLYSLIIPGLDSYHECSNQNEMKSSNKAQQMQEIPIYAIAHAPPFPRKSTSNQLQSSLSPNFAESIGLNSKMNPEGIIHPQFEQPSSRTSSSHTSSAPSSYTSLLPSSYPLSASHNSNLGSQRIRRRKKKLKQIRIHTRYHSERFETCSDGDADAEKDDNEDEFKIISKIKNRKLKKLNSSKCLDYHSQLRFQLHSIWILFCLVFSMTFFKFQST